MLLLLTTSGDGTSDRICERLGDLVFRYNFDQAEQYSLRFTPDEWSILNPAGRKISSDTASAVFFWKAFSVEIVDKDAFVVAETRYIFWELYSWFPASKRRGNSPRFHDNVGKLGALKLASRYFLTPKTVFTYGLPGDMLVESENRVAKSLSSSLTSSGKSLFTTDISNMALSRFYPWFIQEKIISSHDITCLIVGKRIFAFARPRDQLAGLDWRSEQDFSIDSEEWHPWELSITDLINCHNLSEDLNVSWGRYDFMVSKNRDLVFLEFNANGQFVFLDSKNKYGLLDAVISYLTT